MIDIDIEKLIPHRDRMKLIDNILEVGENSAATLSIVNDRWPLFHDGEVSPTVLIELVAQTVGIAAGHKKFRESGKGAYGWIVGIKHANLSDRKIPLGERLVSKAHSLHDHVSYAVFAGTVETESDSNILCEIEIQLFSPE